MDYCKRLKELRVANGYTQEQIAFILHTRQEQYSKYESGKRELPIRHLITAPLPYCFSAQKSSLCPNMDKGSFARCILFIWSDL